MEGMAEWMAFSGTAKPHSLSPLPSKVLSSSPSFPCLSAVPSAVVADRTKMSNGRTTRVHSPPPPRSPFPAPSSLSYPPPKLLHSFHFLTAAVPFSTYSDSSCTILSVLAGPEIYAGHCTVRMRRVKNFVLTNKIKRILNRFLIALKPYCSSVPVSLACS